MHYGRRRYTGMFVGMIVITALVLLIYPTTTKAAGYTISDAASCAAFLKAIGAIGETRYFGECYIYNGTLNAEDSLTVSGNYTLRPQNGQATPAFTNKGSITINAPTGRYYGAGGMDNQGTLTINGSSYNGGQKITNSGTYNGYRKTDTHSGH